MAADWITLPHTGEEDRIQKSSVSSDKTGERGGVLKDVECSTALENVVISCEFRHKNGSTISTSSRGRRRNVASCDVVGFQLSASRLFSGDDVRFRHRIVGRTDDGVYAER